MKPGSVNKIEEIMRNIRSIPDDELLKLFEEVKKHVHGRYCHHSVMMQQFNQLLDDKK